MSLIVLQSWAQAFLLFFTVAIPGRFALEKWQKKTANSVEDWAFAYLLGLLLLFFALYPVGRFIPKYFPLAAWFVALISAGLGILQIAKKRIFLDREDHFFTLALCLLLLCFLSLLSFGLYPGVLTMNMGDIPAYYRVAQNMALGRGLLNDVLILDFAGTYFLPTTHPLLATVGAYLFSLFGINIVALDIVTMVASFFCLALFVKIVSHLMNQDRPLTNAEKLVACAFPFLVQKAFYLFAVSHISFLVGLGILLFTLLIFKKEKNLILYFFLCVFLLLSHSMGVFYFSGILIYITFFVVPRSLRKWVITIDVTGLVLFGYFLVPQLVKHRLTVLPYIEYDDATGFHYHFQQWFDLNYGNVRNYLGLSSDVTVVNEHLFAEIFNHPINFFIFYSKWIFEQIAEYSPWMVSGILSAIFLARKQKSLFLLPILVCSYFAVHRLASANYNVRHFYPAILLSLIPITVIFLRTIRSLVMEQSPQIIHQKFNWAASCLWVTLLISFLMRGQDLYEIRHQFLNLAYMVNASAIQPLLREGDTVANDYPSVMAFLLDRPVMGASNLGTNEEELQLFLQKMKPTFWIYGDVPLPQTPPNAMPYLKFLSPRESTKGYIPVFHNPDQHFFIMKRVIP